MAAACLSGGFWETTAQETLTVEYTLEGVRHELQVDADEEVLEFKNIPLTSLTLPVSLYRLTIATDNNPMTSLKLSEDFGKNARSGERLWRNSPFRILLVLDTSIERLSVHKDIKEFKLVRCERRTPCDGEEFDFPPARRLIRNRSSDNDGVYRIESRHPLLVEVYGFQPTFTITRKAGGVEIGWEAGTLQRSLLIDGPWKDIESGGTERRLFLRPSHPYEFFRVNPRQ